MFFDKDSYGGSIICKITSLSFSFKMVDVCCEGFFFFLLYLHKVEYGSMNIRVTIFNHKKSLMSSQDLPDVIASVIKVHVKPFDLASASLVLLSAVRSATVIISTSQCSSCVASCPLNTEISCSKEFSGLFVFEQNTECLYNA